MSISTIERPRLAGDDGSGKDAFWRDAEEQFDSSATTPDEELVGGRGYEMAPVGEQRALGRMAVGPYLRAAALSQLVMPRFPEIPISQN
jgi:hypothetical protein